jgi:cobalt-zinc-cadmium efflux system protein
MLALVLNAAFLVVEVWAGWWSGSLSLLSDAAHMLGDVTALAVALFAARLAKRAVDLHRTFGLKRAEVLGGFLNALALLAAAAWIAWEAAERLLHGVPGVNAWVVGVVGVTGLAINLGSAWVLWRSDESNLNTRGAMAHMLADALGSVGAILAAVFVAFGVTVADPVVAVLIGAIVAVGAVSLLRDTGRVLLQLPPPGVDVHAIYAALAELDRVEAVHDLHVWTVDGEHAVLSAHLVGDLPDCTGPRHLLAERFGIEHVTLQLESPAMGADCPLRACVGA